MSPRETSSTRRFAHIILLLLAQTVAACGGSSNKPNNIVRPTATPTPIAKVTLSGIAVQNAMSGAEVSVTAVNSSDGSDGATLATTTTAAGGSFLVSISPQPGPVRIRVSKGSFVSEQNGATISSPASISVVLQNIPDSISGVSVNPLTTFIDTQMVGNILHKGQSFSTALDNARSAIETLYSLGSDPARLLPDYTAAGVGSDAGKLGVVLGGLIAEDQALCPKAAGGLVTALAQDVSDGLFDGKANAVVLRYCGMTLPAIAGTAGFEDGLFGVQQLQIATQGFAFGGPGNVLPASVIGAPSFLAELVQVSVGLPTALPASVNSFALPDQTASMNVARYDATATLLGNGKVLIAGGSFDLPGSTDLYDSMTNTFAPPAQTAAMNSVRFSATATLLPNGKVLVAGGAGAGGLALPPLASTDLYDPATNTFAPSAQTASMNDARAEATATLLPNGKVLIAGGIGPDSIPIATTELYDPATNTFAAPSQTAAMNNARFFATATLLPNGKVLIAGGLKPSAAGSYASTELYDPATNTFAPPAQTASMNTARNRPTVTALPNAKVLITGGSNDTTTDLYDSVTNTFAPPAGTGAMNTARRFATATLLPNGRVLIAGGQISLIDAQKSTDLYDPPTNTFAPPAQTASMNSGRVLATATLLPNGKVLIEGRSVSESASAATELYTP